MDTLITKSMSGISICFAFVAEQITFEHLRSFNKSFYLPWFTNPATDPIWARAAMLFNIGALEPLLLLAASTDIPLSDMAGLWELLDKLAPSGIDCTPPLFAADMGGCIGGFMPGKFPIVVRPSPILLLSPEEII